MKADAVRVLRQIERAWPSAMTIADLARACDLSRRDTEAAVQHCRLAGHPIVDAGREGLAWTNDPEELAAYVDSRRRRMASIYLGSRALRKTVRRMREATDLTLFGAA